MPARLFSILALTASGCTVYPHTDSPSLVWSSIRDLDVQGMWTVEASKRLDNPVVFVCHGGDRGRWVVGPDKPRQMQDVDALARTLVNLYAPRPVVLICCNPGRYDLHVPGVWYARDNVWCVPDAIATDHERHVGHGEVGTIWEFTQGK